MVFTTEGFIEVAIEWVGFESTTTEFCSDTLTESSDHEFNSEPTL